MLCVKPNRRREEEGRTNLIGVSFYPYSHLQCKKKKKYSYNEKVFLTVKTYADKFSFLVNCFFLKKKFFFFYIFHFFFFFFFLYIDQAYRHPMEHIAPMHEDNYYHQQNINQVNRLLLSSILF